ncbi:hypothetical protein [uncultured Friedmanniella sp.]|uniref:hypothetical protein n=1 Tax=uncultured Friedmanniella sp. TaxID=335381 RepID=UPI0035CBAD38
MDSSAAFVIIILGIIALAVVGRVAGAMLTSPKVVKLGGDVPNPDRWLPEAAAKSAIGFSSVRWESRAYIVDDADGQPYEHIGLISGAGGRYRVEVRAPHVGPNGSVTAATVHLTAFAYRRSPVSLIILGKYPDNVALAARNRMIRKVKGHARRAAKQRTQGRG